MFLEQGVGVECREALLAEALHNIHVTQSPAAPRPRPDDREAPPMTNEQDAAPDSAATPEDAEPVPALSVAGAARGLGVAPATLRSWERRYGLAPSLHTPGGHRRYGPRDLARLQVMHRLVRQGVPPAEAARVAMREQSAVAEPDDQAPYAAVLDEAGRVEQRDASAGVEGAPPASGAPLLGEAEGDGTVVSVPRPAASARGLVRAAMALDVTSCRRSLATSLSQRGAETTWEELIRPVLRAIGDRWEATGVGVDIEHSFSHVARSVLAEHAGRLGRPRNDRPVLLASAPDEMHSLPLLAVQAALADLAIRCHLLGARTPDEALAAAVTRIGPPVVFLWAQMPTSLRPQLPAMRPAPVLLLGGPGWGDDMGAVQRVRDLGGAVAATSAAMGLEQPRIPRG